MSFEDSESRRFGWTIGWVFLRAILAPRSAQELFFSGFSKILKLFFQRFVAHGKRYRNLLAGILKFKLLMETSRFHCHRSKGRSYRRTFCLNFPKIFSRNFLHFHIFQKQKNKKQKISAIFFYFHSFHFFPKYWNAKPSKYFALLNFQTLDVFPAFPAFPVFLGQKKEENLEKKVAG